MDTTDELLLSLMHTLKRTIHLGAHISSDTLNRGEFFLLGHIHMHQASGNPLTVRELADALSLAPPNLSRMLRGLEERGFISRETDRRDRRNVLVALTPQGQSICEHAKEEIFRRFRLAVNDLGAGHLEQLLPLWNTLLDAIDQHKIQKPSPKSTPQEVTHG